MMEAAVYARYSSENQRETSIEDQVARCRNAAARFSCTVNGHHIYSDMELSGSTAERPGYKRLLTAAKDHQFEAIIVEAQDRLWRDQAEMHAALKRLRFWDIKVFSVAAGSDLTDSGDKLIVSVKGLMDETYLEDLRDKTYRGLLGQINRGFAVGGPPYGYRLNPIHDDSRTDAYGNPLRVGARFTIDEREAGVVRRIFEMYAGGMSPKAIARRLTEDRIPPPRGRIEDGWGPATIHGVRTRGTGILNNEVYRGVMLWGRTAKVRHPDTGRRVPRRRDRSEWFRI